MSRRKNNLRAFLHHNPSPTIEQAWDSAWEGAQKIYHSKSMQERDAMLAEKDALLKSMAEALKGWLEREVQNTCQHENTYRGGVIWEICAECDMAWADDKGGKPKFKVPKEWMIARALIARYEEQNNG